jgi:hypothetical protein
LNFMEKQSLESARCATKGRWKVKRILLWQ